MLKKGPAVTCTWCTRCVTMFSKNFQNAKLFKGLQQLRVFARERWDDQHLCKNRNIIRNILEKLFRHKNKPSMQQWHTVCSAFLLPAALQLCNKKRKANIKVVRLYYRISFTIMSSQRITLYRWYRLHACAHHFLSKR